VTVAVDRQAIYDELERVRATYRKLLTEMSTEDLRRPTNGTKWTNKQLLFHMLLGYWLIRALLPLLRFFTALPPGASKAFAATLNAVTRPFNWVNYVVAVPPAAVLSPSTLVTRMDNVTSSLAKSLSRRSDADLAKGMYFPDRWDPFFKKFMTRADLYHFPTQHFDFHSRQLS